MVSSRTRSTRLLIATSLLILAAARGAGADALITRAADPRPRALEHWAEQALSSSLAESAPALVGLRAAGPLGLEALFVRHAAVLERGPTDLAWKRLTAALDAVARQRDAWASRLYWYTDLERAKA